MSNCCYFCGREVTSGKWIEHPIGKLTVQAFCCSVCQKSIRTEGEKHD